MTQKRSYQSGSAEKPSHIHSKILRSFECAMAIYKSRPVSPPRYRNKIYDSESELAEPMDMTARFTAHFANSERAVWLQLWKYGYEVFARTSDLTVGALKDMDTIVPIYR